MNDDELHQLASEVATPFWLVEGDRLLRDVAAVEDLHDPDEDLVVRYAMKANSTAYVLEVIRRSGLWIDAVGAGELRIAREAGFTPETILLTSDVFRSDAIQQVLDHGHLPNLGSPGMLEELLEAGYRGPIGLRLNPGFGHGHTRTCDTGGPHSKHGMRAEDLLATAERALTTGCRPTLLHGHVGSGPSPDEFVANTERLMESFLPLLEKLPTIEAVNLGGGWPHRYRSAEPELPMETITDTIRVAMRALRSRSGRRLRIEVEPGRRLVAGCTSLVTRVKDRKRATDGAQGDGLDFVMVDAGFTELVRPAMYGAWHDLDLIPSPGTEAGRTPTPVVVAGPLCESGDVFTRDHAGHPLPRELADPRRGDLIRIRDAGAYGVAMSSGFTSVDPATIVFV